MSSPNLAGPPTLVVGPNQWPSDLGFTLADPPPKCGCPSIRLVCARGQLFQYLKISRLIGSGGLVAGDGWRGDLRRALPIRGGPAGRVDPLKSRGRSQKSHRQRAYGSFARRLPFLLYFHHGRRHTMSRLMRFSASMLFLKYHIHSYLKFCKPQIAGHNLSASAIKKYAVAPRRARN